MRSYQQRFPLVFILLVAFCVFPGEPTLAQSKSAGPEKSPLCTAENALEMVKQQIAITKTFNDSTRRITVLMRAADLLWPHGQTRARAAFTEAFDLATELEKENDRKGPRSVILRLQKVDQRYVVIRAVARKDSAWAKELTRQMLKKEADERAGPSSRDAIRDVLTAERLLQSANDLIATDLNAALDLARASLNYPASSALSRFLYRLAAVNQNAADQFYSQALSVYGERPMREFLYLQAYPFAWRDTLNTPVFAFYYEVPANFVSNQALQRQFIQLVLRRAQQAIEAPSDQTDTYQDTNARWQPATVHLLRGLIRLEPYVRENLPDLLPQLTQAREKILVSLSVETQKLLLQPGQEISSAPEQTFEERIESARKVADLNERDELITSAVFGSEKADFTNVVQAIDKISDSNLRAHASEWFYFQRARVATNNKQFEEAERLTSKVEGMEQRAYLHLEMAKGLLNGKEGQTKAQEMIDEAIIEAKKAGTTIFAARALLSASILYNRFDRSRAISVLSDAINCINRIDAPDFITDDQSVEKEVERKGRDGHYHGEYLFHYHMPGLDPERAFREFAKLDFDTALSQSNALTDKFQRALSTLAIADECLQQPPQPAKEKSKKNARP